MRIISGKKKGLKLFSPIDYNVRPTTDKVKESIFNTLADIDSDAVVLDLFAGSGAMGIEFLSRGAKLVYFCDVSNKSLDVVKKNLIKSEFLNDSVIVNKDFVDSLNFFFENNLKFDYIFLDPPYMCKYVSKALELIFKHDILSYNGLIIVETDRDVDIENFKIIKEKNYSKTRVLFLGRN